MNVFFSAGMQGQLDLQCSLKRLVVADLMPGLVNAVMLLRCDSLDREEGEAIGVARLKASDHTGVQMKIDPTTLIKCSVAGSVNIILFGFGEDTYQHINPSQVFYEYI